MLISFANNRTRENPSLPEIALRRIRGLIGVLFDARPRVSFVSSGKAIVGRDVEGLHHVQFAGQNTIGRGTTFAGDLLRVGLGTTIGANCFLHGPVTIGKFCQLGPAVAIYGRDHAMTYVTTYLNRQLFSGRLRSHAQDAPVVVGNDVWIGHGAVLLRGITVGNGAIIGAGSIVTKDVPAYAVAVGNPARTVRQRFDSDITELLEQLAWWDAPVDQLPQFEKLFHVDFLCEPELGKKMLREFISAQRLERATG